MLCILVLLVCVPAVLAADCATGCTCIAPGDAKQNGYELCGGKQQVCGYDQYQNELYCYLKGTAVQASAIAKIPETIPTTVPPLCPTGCGCMAAGDAKQNGYELCGGKQQVCGYDQYQNELYCYSKGTAVQSPAVTKAPETITTAAPSPCPTGCTCLSKEKGTSIGYPFCRGTATVCGYDNNVPLYCFEQVPNPACVYDYQKNTCTGTCQQGYSCSLIASSTDKNGRIEYAVCDCTGQPSTPCTYDREKNTCTGTCSSGSGCAILGKKVDTATGAVDIVCGCPEAAGCSFDYATDACTGSCAASGDTCQLNTISRDPLTGKTTYAECHCKGPEGAKAAGTPLATAPPAPATPCVSDSATGGCTGTCPASQTCGSFDCTINSTGIKVCTTCRCIGCEYDTALGSCSGYCAVEGQTCECAAWTTDSTGKMVCGGGACSCRQMCRWDTMYGCSGECPGGDRCRLLGNTTGKDGEVSPVCGCGSAALTPVAKSAGGGGDVIKVIGDFFKNLFGWK